VPAPARLFALALAWLVLALAVFGLIAAAGSARGAEPSAAQEAGAAIAQQARQFVADSSALPGMRLEVEVGELDPRLKLAPCDRIEPYLPSGVRLWAHPHRTVTRRVRRRGACTSRSP
jgi:flagella basal body P-ring formation protein FlgA